jgi:hypothetical protein
VSATPTPRIPSDEVVRPTGPTLDPSWTAVDPSFMPGDDPLAAIVTPLLRTAFMPDAIAVAAAPIGAAIAAGAMRTVATREVARSAPAVHRAAKVAPPNRPTPQQPLGPTNPWATATGIAVGGTGAAMSSLLLLAIFFTTSVAVPPQLRGRLLGLATATGPAGFEPVLYRPG